LVQLSQRLITKPQLSQLSGILATKGSVILTSSPHNRHGRNLLFFNPIKVNIRSITNVSPHIRAGYVSYEALHNQLRISTPVNSTIPTIYLSEYKSVIEWQNSAKYATIYSINQQSLTEDLAFYDSHLDNICKKDYATKPSFHHLKATQNFKNNVATVVDYIHAGRIFQANIAFKKQARIEENHANLFWLYHNLYYSNPANYGAYVNIDDDSKVLSCSPERFFSKFANVLTASPIKGTIALNYSDAQLLSAKNKAENLMIVDLLRNDITQICDNVEVSKLWHIEKLANLKHLVSTIKGRIKPNLGLYDIMRNIFPCGSITGAPKIEAMRVINELETTPRSVYCGAIGYAMPYHGDMQWNVAIRTMLYHQGQLDTYAGCGIVADSSTESEYREAELKIKALSS
jgi:anthranilate/para-aminobenzoate synthase component I